MSKIQLNNIWQKIVALLFSSVYSSACSAIGLFLMLKVMGLNSYGTLMLAFSYITIVGVLFNLQSYDSFVRFMPEYERNEKKNQLISQLFITDIITALIAFFISILLYYPLMKIFSWNHELSRCYLILSFFIIFNIKGTFDGIYRYYNFFNWISIRDTISASILLVFYFLGYVLNLDIYYFSLILVIQPMLRLVFDFMYLIKVQEKIKLKFYMNVSIDKKVLKFNFISNLTSHVDLPIKHLTPIIIASIIGVDSLGFFKVLERFGNIIRVFISVFSQFFGSEISRLISLGRISDVLKLGRKFTFVCLFFGFVVTIIYYFLIKKITFNDFVFTEINVIDSSLYVLYMFIISSMFYQHSVAIYSGLEVKVLKLAMLINCIYLILLIPISLSFSLMGVILFQILQSITIFVIKDSFIRGKYNVHPSV
ncbi:lipopolysaccharide biosynthesis protein [Photobacterium carnosum]|uniref:lipopolysaccharide biosynthesis protein n=1 Tax=Photobacterium carnosum TaxID=2023717 RepID=UPI001E4F94E7|nr:oligosaccharide flippase family protein [Photobacterium carnosum]